MSRPCLNGLLRVINRRSSIVEKRRLNPLQPRFYLKSILLSALAVISIAPGATAQEFDVVIRNGHVLDGTGSPWYAGDIGIRHGRIAKIGVLSKARTQKSIDAKGLTVAPGFIDMLGSRRTSILANPHLPSKIFQGITTEITGEGGSVAPATPKFFAEDLLSLEHYGVKGVKWQNFSEYFADLERRGIGINLASYVGATQVRRVVIGEDNRAPSPTELERMEQLVAEAMGQGAVGLSTALQYAPAPYASTEELIALAGEAAKAGGIYATHMRSEGDAIDTALEETFRIGREAGIPVEIWHLKAAGKRNWGRMPEIVGRIEAARRSGIDVEADTYAYTAWFNSFSAFVPPWVHDGGDSKMVARLKDPATRLRIRNEMVTTNTGWDNEWQEIPGPEAILVSVVTKPELLRLQGKTIAQIAQEEHKDPIDTIFDLLLKIR